MKYYILIAEYSLEVTYTTYVSEKHTFSRKVKIT